MHEHERADDEGDRAAVEAFAAETRRHGAATYGPSPNDDESGQLPFYVDVDAESPDNAIDRAVELADPRSDLQTWLHYSDRWSTEELPPS